ncbi:MAG: replication-relaxation family protein [Deltaproteobacteria bacterium]|nr:replication-relaxation family protein [Deltaproteobacteria bacterium]
MSEETEITQLEIGKGKEGGGKEKQKWRRKKPGTRVTEREAFLVTELLRVRRLTVRQIARLAFVNDEAGRWIVRRLVCLGLVEEQFVDRLSSDKAILLTDEGYRFACRRAGVEPNDDYFRDRIGWEQRVHAVAISELYVDLVTAGVGSWLDARGRADAFTWRVSNADTAFRWIEPRDVNKRVGRQVIPDVTLETDATRYLVEIERPTKSLGRVLSEKIAPYNHLFSLGRVVAERSAYAQKYPDTKAPVVLFVCHSAARAKSVRECFEKAAARQGFYIPAWRVGASAEVGGELAAEIFGARPVKPASPDELRERLRRMLDVAIGADQAISEELLWVARVCVPAKEMPAIEQAIRHRQSRGNSRRPRPASDLPLRRHSRP